MGWQFDEVDDDVQLTDDPLLSIPNGDWTVGGWFRLHNGNAGTDIKYVLNHDVAGSTPSFSIFIREASTTFPPADRLDVEINAASLVAAGVGASTAWQHIIVERSGTTLTLYINNTSQDTDTLSVAVNPVGNLFFASRIDSDAAFFFGGRLGDWFKLERVLTATERANLQKQSAARVLSELHSDTSAWYLPMRIGGAGGDYQDTLNQLTVTNSGSTNASDHPPIDGSALFH